METVGALAAVVAGDSVADGVGPAPDPGPDLGTGRGDPPAGRVIVPPFFLKK